MKHTTKSNAKKSLAEIKKEVNEARVKENELLLSMTPAQRVEYLRAKRKPINSNGITLDKQTAKKIAKETRAARTVKTVAKSKDTKSSTENSFIKALTDFENIIIERSNGIYNEHRYYITTIQICKAIIFSILKKLIEVSQKTPKEGTTKVSCDLTMQKIRNELIIDFAYLDSIDYCNSQSYAKMDKNGNIQCKFNDSELEQALFKALDNTFGDGMDLINKAAEILLEEVKNADNFSVGYFSKALTDRALKNGKVYTLNGSKKIEWVTIETTSIQRVYRAIRKYIQDNKSIKAIINQYSYIEGVSIDEDTQKIESIFYRLHKGANIGGYAYDFNGSEIAYIVDVESVKEWQDVLSEFIEKTNISQKHIDIIEMRNDNKPLIEISRKIGVSVRTVSYIIDELQKLAVDYGYAAESMLKKISNEEKARQIECWIYTDYNAYKDYYCMLENIADKSSEHYKSIEAEMKKYKPISTVASLRKAEQLTGVSKTAVDKVLRGQMMSAKGYKFRYTDTPITAPLK